jgi:hypothetical protein
MTNNKQTAVEWLLNAIETKNGEEFSSYYSEFIEQAKEMEKQRIIDAHYEGQCDETEGYPLELSKQYYNETYGGGEQ